MIVLIFGVSNVGKSTVGTVLAEKLGYYYFDVDDAVKEKYHMTMQNFVDKYDLQECDKRRAKLVNECIKKYKNNIVVAVTPTTYLNYYHNIISRNDALNIVLDDDDENIFERLVFTDDNDQILSDSIEYKNKYKNHYLRAIHEDRLYYGRVYSGLENVLHMHNQSPEKVADMIIDKFCLK